MALSISCSVMEGVDTHDIGESGERGPVDGESLQQAGVEPGGKNRKET